DARRGPRVPPQPPVMGAPGTTEAAKAHLGVLVARLRLINRELRRCHHRLDALCDELAGEDLGPENSEGQIRGQRDVTILRSLPGVGRIVLATLLAEASQP